MKNKELFLFTTSYCSVCPQMHEVFDEIASEHKDIHYYPIDPTTNTDLAKRFKVRSVPTLVYLVNGVQVGYLNGLQSKDAVLEMMGR